MVKNEINDENAEFSFKSRFESGILEASAMLPVRAAGYFRGVKNELK